ncbi:MAG: hypothetical protein AAGK09_06195 [Planctomycetota bacterium]
MAVVFVAAPWAHETFHDHSNGCHTAHQAVDMACSGHHHHHDHPAPAIPANDTPADDEQAPERDDCRLCRLLYAPAMPTVPPAIVTLTEAIPPTHATLPIRRIPLSGVSHSFGTRGPPIV